MNIKPFTEQDYIELEKKDTLERINTILNHINKLKSELLRTNNTINVFRVSNSIIRAVTELTADKIYLIDLEKGKGN